MPRNFVITERISFLEDKADEIPVILCQNEDETFMSNVCFAIVKQCKLVKGTFIKLPFKKGDSTLSIARSSEILVGQRNQEKNTKSGYLSQKYMISKYCHQNQYTEIYEVTVKVNHASDYKLSKGEDLEDLRFSAILSGFKVVYSQSTNC